MRRVSALFLAFVLAVLFWGCKEKQTQKEEEAASENTSQATVAPPADALVPAEDTEGEHFGDFVPFS